VCECACESRQSGHDVCECVLRSDDLLIPSDYWAAGLQLQAKQRACSQTLHAEAKQAHRERIFSK
jgi:hypothetical protein